MRKVKLLVALGLFGAISLLYLPLGHSDSTSEQDVSPTTDPAQQADLSAPADDAVKKKKKIVKSAAEWRKQLTPMQYRVTREKATERQFTGKYWRHKAAGTYTCVCCGEPLFASATKYKSGTGWPSFFAPFNDDQIGTSVDRSFFMVRTEVHCSRCDAHLGHVFPDGPRPTGLRYCINSAALGFEPAEKSPKTTKHASETPEPKK